MIQGYENKVLSPTEKPGADNVYAIIASGPSLTQQQVDYCRGKAKVVVINDNYLRAPWADYLYFCDDKWFQWHKDRDAFRQFAGKIYAQYQAGKGHDRNLEKLAEIYTGFPIHLIASVHEAGLSTDPGVIHQAAGLPIYAGFSPSRRRRAARPGASRA